MLIKKIKTTIIIFAFCIISLFSQEAKDFTVIELNNPSIVAGRSANADTTGLPSGTVFSIYFSPTFVCFFALYIPKKHYFKQ